MYTHGALVAWVCPASGGASATDLCGWNSRSSFGNGNPLPLPTLGPGAKFIKQTATGAATGADWDNALGSSALKSAIEAGGTVYVAAGVYAPSNVIYLRNNNTGHFINPFAKSGIEDKNRLRVNSTERGHGVKQLSN
jgi:hypothetical protein